MHQQKPPQLCKLFRQPDNKRLYFLNNADPHTAFYDAAEHHFLREQAKYHQETILLDRGTIFRSLNRDPDCQKTTSHLEKEPPIKKLNLNLLRP